MIQIRNVPDDVHRTLKVRAAAAGMSLSDYLLRQISEDAQHDISENVQQLTLEEWFDRVRRLEPCELDEDPAVTIRKLRGPLPRS